MQCTSLQQMIIPSSVTSIMPFVFSNCTSFMNVIIPSSVNKISDNTFAFCSSLEQMTIHSNATSIECYAFEKRTTIYKVTFMKPSFLSQLIDMLLQFAIHLIR